MWHEWIRNSSLEAEFGQAATESEISRAEIRLSEAFPDELHSLLLETNGIADAYGTDIIWTVERTTEENTAFRSNPELTTLYLPFQNLLFFGDNGGGDQFAFVQRGGQSEIWSWDHETDERQKVAQSLEEYIRRCLESDGEDWHRDI